MATESKGHGIQSVELGLGILMMISEERKPLTATEISVLCGISKSKLHKYLTSFTKIGFLQKSQDLKYSLGTELIHLGLKASEQLDIRDICIPYITKLREALNETVALAIWGESGPFFLRWEQSDRAINLGIKVGSRVSVTESAPGRLFSAYLPKAKTQSLISSELKSDQLQETLVKELETIKRKGFAITSGTLVHGITAVSCPVFDPNGSILAALTVVSMKDALDTDEHSDFITTLKQTALALSQELGFKP
ncbi:IclR family transcriptional regulator [Paenibacillus glycinis]|nr:IclR family transcriptional regulator [Paenibacillus glycinis]